MPSDSGIKEVERKLKNSFLSPPIKHLRKENQLSLKRLLRNSAIDSSRPDSKFLISSRDFYEEVSKLKETCPNLKELPKKILALKLFKNYRYCSISIHTKGSQEVSQYTSTINQESFKTISHVEDFNNAFNSIKKSKNKLFNKNQLNSLSSNSIGTFLAKIYELKKQNVIFLISRNDFLIPDSEEHLLFEHATRILFPLIEKCIRKNHLIEKHELINEIFQKIPFSFGEGKGNFYPIINGKEKEKIASDIFHFQRINLLGELLNTLKHELSNPLFGLKLSIDILKNEDLEEDIKMILNEISKNCIRCQTILENFSGLYRDDEEITEINLKKIINEISILTKSETREIEKEVFWENFEKEEDYLIHSNPTWLSQIIFNFIMNSTQAIKQNNGGEAQGRITIRTLRKIDEASIIISVEDNGPGITDSGLKKIFSPFFTTKTNGTGLGLTICQNLAKKLKGKIIPKNNFPLPGVTFSIKLPLNP